MVQVLREVVVGGEFSCQTSDSSGKGRRSNCSGNHLYSVVFRWALCGDVHRLLFQPMCVHQRHRKDV